MPKLKQSWNSRSQKWVLFVPGEKANILGMRPSKFEGIEVEKARPAENEDLKDEDKKESSADQAADKSEVAEGPVQNKTENGSSVNKDSGFWL